VNREGRRGESAGANWFESFVRTLTLFCDFERATIEDSAVTVSMYPTTGSDFLSGTPA